MAKNHEISDGRTVQITLLTTKEKGDPHYLEGFHGVVQEDGSSGDSISLDIGTREWQVNVGSLTAAKGDVLYIDTDGALTNTDTDRSFGKVSQAKDSNNVALVILLPQEVDAS